MPRLVCVVEGHGDVEALPVLCARIIHRLEAHSWSVDKNPVRQPRSRLVNERQLSPRRIVSEGLPRAVALASSRPADGVLVVCDSDDDCAAIWGPSATALVRQTMNGAAVMIVREYETWLVASLIGRPRIGHQPLETIRGTKEVLKDMISEYRPSHDQARLTRGLHIDTVWAISDS